jgi:hypothetical protein
MSQQAILDALLSVLDEEHAIGVIEHRRVTIKKPLTVMAAKLLAKRFAEWGNANEAAEIMIERTWRGFESGWIKDRRPMKPRNAGELARMQLAAMRTDDATGTETGHHNAGNGSTGFAGPGFPRRLTLASG